MTDLQCFEQALKDYKALSKLIKGVDFCDCIEHLQSKGHDIWVADDDLFDINFGTCCFTITCYLSKSVIVSTSIEVWNDSECNCLGDYTLKEIKEIVKKGGKQCSGKSKQSLM